MKLKSNFDVLLLQTPPNQTIMPPLGLAILKASIKEFNRKIEVKNVDFSCKYTKKFKKEVSKIKRKIIRKMEYNILTNYVIERLSSISIFRPFLRNLLFFSSETKDLILEFYIRERFFNILNKKKDDIDSIDLKILSLIKPIIKEILSYNPTIVGFSANTLTLPVQLNIANELKKESENIKIIFGGPSINYAYDILMNDYNFLDYCIVGEGEKSLPSLVDCIMKIKKVDIPGVIFRSGKKVIYRPQKKFVNLNKIPYPDFDDFNLKNYKVLPFESQRGCVNKCNYCNIRKAIFCETYREKSSERISREIKFLIDKYGINDFFFCENIFNAYPMRIKNVCKYLKKNDIKWASSFFPKISSEEAHWLKNSGCILAILGIESLSNKLLKKMNRKSELYEIIRTLKNLKEVKIKTLSSFFFSFPGETYIDILNTTRYLLEFKKYFDAVGINYYSLSLDSNVYLNPKKFGIFINTNLSKWEKIYGTVAYSEVSSRTFKNFFTLIIKKILDNILQKYESWERLFYDVY